MKISLSYPKPVLNPNNKKHWAIKAKAQKVYKKEAYITSIEALDIRKRNMARLKDVIAVDVVFYPPDNRRRDLDNMIASMKYAFDGIADALTIDDSKFRFTFDVGDKIKCGKVDIKINI